MVKTERQPLSRDRIAAAAVAFIDENGIAGLSMRKLGAELSVEAMSLYNYVSNKEDLLDAASDVILDELLAEATIEPSTPFAQGVRQLCESFRAAGERHPRSMELIYDRPLNSLRGLEYLQVCYDVFGKVANDPDQAALAFSAAASMITGYVRHEATVIAALADLSFEDVVAPASLANAIELRRSCVVQTEGERFEVVLDVLIAGLESRFAR